MVAMELSILQDEFKVILISCSEQHTAILNNIRFLYPENRCEIITLPLPFRFRYLNFKKKSYPSPHSTMTKAASYLKNSDAIISTSHSTVKMCKKLKVTKPKIIYQYHGCGDRKYSFDPSLGAFDFMLLPGKYYLKRLMEEKVTGEQKTAIIGYPKLDYLVNAKHLKEKLFSNDKLVILYSPHWKPELTSYKLWGKQIVEHFYKSRKYNLIFAPHVLIKHWRFHYGYDLNLDKYKCDHIHIDFESLNSVNSSYLHIADLYMGDVSSLVYEWIAIQPRPCIFLNAHNIQWLDNDYYRHWNYGPVVKSLSEMEQKIEEAVQNSSYLKIQKERIVEYMDITDEPSSRRAANAIYNFLIKEFPQACLGVTL